MKTVTIVLLNWNGWRDTAECLLSLAKLDYPAWNTIVVDNGSTDDSVPSLREAFPAITMIEAGENLGFAGGCNLGIQAAMDLDSDFVWLINNDTVVHAQALRDLIETAETDARIGAVGSLVYSMETPKVLVCWGGGHVNFLLGRSRHFVGPTHNRKIEYITGASLLLRRSAIESQGLLDSGFFMYWEDADYCFRLRESGWKLAVAPGSKIWHKESASIGKASARMDNFFNRSAARFFRKHAAIPAVPIVVGVAFRLAKRILRGDWKHVRAVWDGVWSAETAPLP